MAYTGPKLSQLHGPALQQRLKVLASNPATRSAVPTRYLTGGLAKYAQQRNLNARLDTPVVPGSTLTGRGLAQEANAAVQTQYGPQDQALQQQLLSNQNQPLVTGGYFDTYINTLRQAAADQKAAVAGPGGLVGQLQNMASTGQTAAQGANTGILTQLQADAAKRGATVDPKLAATFQAGTNVNAGLANAQAGTAGLLGQAEQNYLSGLTAGAEAGRAQALNAIGGKRADLLAQQTQLKATEGAANEAYRSKRVSQEATNVATQTLAGVNATYKQGQLKVAQTNSKTAQQRASSAQATAQTKLSDAEATFAAAHGGYSPQDFAKLPFSQQRSVLHQVKQATTVSRSGTGKDAFGNSPKDIKRNSSSYNKVLRIAKVIGGSDPGSILQGLTLKFPTIDDTILVGAAQQAALAHVGPKTAVELRKMGITGGYSVRYATSGGQGSAPAAEGPGKGKRPT